MISQQELIEIAIEAREKSYSPYSNFAVGAAILCTDGSVYIGANIENASYPLCMCAERNAIYNAMMDGKTSEDFLALAVVADTEGPCSPCGACRQVISELLPEDADIIMSNLGGQTRVVEVADLLPFAFDGKDL